MGINTFYFRCDPNHVPQLVSGDVARDMQGALLDDERLVPWRRDGNGDQWFRVVRGAAIPVSELGSYEEIQAALASGEIECLTIDADGNWHNGMGPIKPDRGFGFIADQGSGGRGRRFFHARDTDPTLPFDETLLERSVQFDPGETEKGLIATNVKAVGQHI